MSTPKRRAAASSFTRPAPKSLATWFNPEDYGRDDTTKKGANDRAAEIEGENDVQADCQQKHRSLHAVRGTFTLAARPLVGRPFRAAEGNRACAESPRTIGLPDATRDRVQRGQPAAAGAIGVNADEESQVEDLAGQLRRMSHDRYFA